MLQGAVNKTVPNQGNVRAGNRLIPAHFSSLIKVEKTEVILTLLGRKVVLDEHKIVSQRLAGDCKWTS